MTDKTYKVLVLCTGNSARSIMAEALINTMGNGRFKAYSAGSHPNGRVNPFAIEKVASVNYPTDTLRSKSWDEFAQADAPQMDFIMTVCDQAAGEACPAWPGQPITAHWGFADPTKVEGDREKQLRAFSHAQFQIANRIRLFMSLPIEKIDRMSLQTKLRELGQQRDA